MAFDIDKALARVLDDARDATISSYRIAEAFQSYADQVRQQQALTGLHSAAVGYRG